MWVGRRHLGHVSGGCGCAIRGGAGEDGQPEKKGAEEPIDLEPIDLRGMVAPPVEHSLVVPNPFARSGRMLFAMNTPFRRKLGGTMLRTSTKANMDMMPFLSAARAYQDDYRSMRPRKFQARISRGGVFTMVSGSTPPAGTVFTDNAGIRFTVDFVTPGRPDRFEVTEPPTMDTETAPIEFKIPTQKPDQLIASAMQAMGVADANVVTERDGDGIPTKVIMRSLRVNGPLHEDLLRVSSLVELTIIMCGITELPTRMSGLRELRKLNVAQNNLRSIPDEINSLHALTHLNVSGNNLQRLPESLEDLTRITYLNVGDNPLRTLPPRVIQNMLRLHTLNASSIEMRYLPISVTQSESLRELNLSGNRIHDLRGIGRMTQLRELDVSINPLDELPAEMSDLVSLESLIASGTALAELPEVLQSMRALRTLIWSGNEVRELPQWIGELTNITELDISMNQLFELPREIGNMRSLRVLNVDLNDLSRLPATLGQLRNLERLSANETGLHRLPIELTQCASLAILHINNNRIDELPQWIGQLTSVTELDLSSNQLRALPDEIGNLHSLRVLKVDLNELSELPASLGHLQNLERLSAFNNLLRSLPIELTQCQSLEYINVMHNDLEDFPAFVTDIPALKQFMCDVQAAPEITQRLRARGVELMDDIPAMDQDQDFQALDDDDL